MNRVRVSMELQVEGESEGMHNQVFDLDVETRPVVALVTSDGTVVARVEAVGEESDG